MLIPAPYDILLLCCLCYFSGYLCGYFSGYLCGYFSGYLCGHSFGKKLQIKRNQGDTSGNYPFPLRAKKPNNRQRAPPFSLFFINFNKLIIYKPTGAINEN